MLPLTLLTYGFLAGCAGLLLQIVLVVLLGQDAAITRPAPLFIVAAATIEELMKFSFLAQAIRRYGPAVTVLPSILFGLGFVGVEIGLFYWTNGHQPIALQSFFNILFHIGTAVTLALCLRRYGPRGLIAWGALGLMAALHSLYNFSRL